LDRPGLLIRAGLAIGVVAVSLGIATCGGDTAQLSTNGDGQVSFTDDRSGLVTPEPASDSANRQPRGPSVTYNDPPPPIAAAVKAAASAAGCSVRGFFGEPAAVQSDGTYHVSGDPVPAVSIPPLSGLHNPRWADWGVYNRTLPYKYQVHNLEHGGVIIHYAKDVPVEGVNALRELWAKSPAYVIVVPDSHPKFTPGAVVAGSWQRWIVCKSFTPAQISAIEAFVNEDRGRGPEQALASDAGGDKPADLPAPVIADNGAKR